MRLQVFAHEDWEGQNSWLDNYRPDAGKDMVFDYKYKPKVTDDGDALDEAKKYINATVTQLFYTSNMVHDLYYRCVSFASSRCSRYLPTMYRIGMASMKFPATSSNTTLVAEVKRTTPSLPMPRTAAGTTMLTS
jgi:hypothetical protein